MSDDDKKLFREAMRGVKPLKSSNRTDVLPLKKHKKIIHRAKRDSDEQTDIENIPYIAHKEDVTGECKLSFLKPGVDTKILKQLKAGKYPSQLTVDLHGYTVAEAELKLISAWQYAEKNELRVLLIIHGKGKQAQGETAKIKSLVNRFLHSMPNVLAFCSARVQDGGVGACYVLLKRNRG